MDFVDYVRVLRRFWALMIVCAVVAAVLAVGVESTGTKSYISTVRVAAGPAKAIDLHSDIADSVNALDRRSVMSTYAELASSNRLRAKAASTSKLKAGDFTTSAVVLAQANSAELTVKGNKKGDVTKFAGSLASATNSYFVDFYRLYRVDVINGPTAAKSAGVSAVGLAILAAVVGAAIGFLLGLARQRLSDNATAS